jgi:hypothetical protein
VNPTATFTVTPSGPLTFCAGGNVRFNVTNSNAGTYVWYRNNIVVYTGTATSYTATTAGVYKMRAQLGQCGVFSIPYTVSVPCREGEVLPGELNFTAYPNPFNSNTTFAFELEEEQSISVRLFDAAGKLIDVILDQAMMPSGETRIDYTASSLTAGMYYAEITTPSATKRIRLIATE